VSKVACLNLLVWGKAFTGVGLPREFGETDYDLPRQDSAYDHHRCPPEQVAEGDRIFRSHAPWMEATHHRTGEKALLSYNVSNGPELSNPMDLNSAPTGNTYFVLTEIYETEASVADHFQQTTAKLERLPCDCPVDGEVQSHVRRSPPTLPGRRSYSPPSSVLFGLVDRGASWRPPCDR
jgi:hypothetical protein